MHPTAGRPPATAPAPGGVSGGSALDPVKLIKQYYPYLVLALMIGTGLGVAAHFVLVQLYPMYTSAVLFECRDPLEKGFESGRRPQGRDEQERYVGTQVQLMISRLIEEPALDARELRDTQWAAPYLDEKKAIDKTRAMRRLEKDLSARPLPQSNLIQLRMSTHDAKDAMLVVNAVADAYITDHRRGVTKGSTDQKTVLGGQVSKLEDRIKQLKLEREQVLKEAKLDAADVANQGDSIELMNISKTLVDVMGSLRSVESRQTDYKQRLAETQAGHYPDDLRERAQTESVIEQYDQKLASLRDAYGALRKQGFGDNHPDVKSVKAQMDEVEVQRQEHMNEVLDRMWSAEVAQIDSAMRSLEAQRKEYDDTKKKNTDRRQEILQATVRFSTLENEIKIATDELALTQRAYQDLDILGFRSGENTDSIGDRVRIVSRGVIPKSMSFPKLEVVVPAVAFLFTGLVGGFLFLREVLDQRVRGPSDAAMVPRVKVLGVVPDAAEDPSRPASIQTVFRDNPTGVLTESFRQMRAPLIQAMERSGHKSLVIVGCMPGSGSTTVAANLALAVAGADERVLLIDANFRRPALQRVFKLGDGPGLGDVLAGTCALEQALQSTSSESLKIMTAGTPGARAIPERLAGDAMSRLLLEASTRFDMILVDVPPAVVSGDGYAMANKCDAAIIVCRAMNEKRGLLARVRNQLGESRAEFLGVVVNAVRASAGGYFKRNIKATHQYHVNGKE